jgi:hypothetical protein
MGIIGPVLLVAVVLAAFGYGLFALGYESGKRASH